MMNDNLAPVIGRPGGSLRSTTDGTTQSDDVNPSQEYEDEMISREPVMPSKSNWKGLPNEKKTC
jgi:hypothetical protein